MTEYKLKCLQTEELLDDNYLLHHTDGALLQAAYPSKMILQNQNQGLWKYLSWLPVSHTNEHVAGTVTYKSTELGEALGMSDLWITFHGYWPERNGICPTGSFKDMEAVPTLQRLKDHGCSGMICASAGNTARAFSYFCGADNFPLIVVVSSSHQQRLWLPKGHPRDSLKIVVIEDGDYYDSKVIAKELGKKLTGWQLEGSVHNVARRDGIGSLIVDAAFTINRLPQHYFQGIGGGPGPIGVHEMAVRLIESGQFEGPPPRQHVSQNIEHCPIHNAWQSGRNHLTKNDFPSEEVEVFSDYLLNKSPAYGLKGGVYDILETSQGQTYVVSREEAIESKKLFETLEGIDILSPGAVALASLRQALESSEVGKDECVVLNISGGGINRLKDEIETEIITPWLTTDKESAVQNILLKLNGK